MSAFLLGGRDVSSPWSGQIQMSPGDAERCLGINLGNRRVRNQLVEYLCRCIANDEWQADHPQPIVFTQTTRMIDGQHRCLAIAKSGITVCCNVVFGARNELREYIDTGISRTLEDRVSFSDSQQQNRHIAAIVNAYAWLSSPSVSFKGRLTPEEAMDVFGLHKQGVIFGAEFMAKNLRSITRTPVAAALVTMFERDQMKAIEFANSLVIPDGHVQQARVLRDTLLRTTSGGGMASSKLAYLKSVSAMKAHLQDREIKIIRPSQWE